MFSTGCYFQILLILTIYIKEKVHNGDLEDGYNDVISAKEIYVRKHTYFSNDS